MSAFKYDADLRNWRLEWMRRIVNKNEFIPAVNRLVEMDFACSRAEGRRIYFQLKGKNHE